MSRFACFVAGALLGVLTALAIEADAQRQWRTPMPLGLRLPAPAWLHWPPVAMHVRWIRAHGATSEVRDGVCVLYMADTERGLEHAEDQVTHCARLGARPLAEAPAGAVLLHWHPVHDEQAVADLYEQVYVGTAGARIVGFYLHRGGAEPCHVVTTPRHFALGHEIKHCHDGEFHPRRGQPAPR